MRARSHGPQPKLVQLPLELGAALEQGQCLAGVVFVDPREREPHVDQDPVADLDRRSGLVHERHADLATHAGDVHLREPRVAVDDFDHLSGNAEAHYEAPSVAAATAA